MDRRWNVGVSTNVMDVMDVDVRVHVMPDVPSCLLTERGEFRKLVNRRRARSMVPRLGSYIGPQLESSPI